MKKLLLSVACACFIASSVKQPTTEIPADKGSYDRWDKLEDESYEQRRGIIGAVQKSVDAVDPDQQKIADLYLHTPTHFAKDSRYHVRRYEVHLQSQFQSLRVKLGFPILSCR
jgi:predicted metalloendopeptidase